MLALGSPRRGACVPDGDAATAQTALDQPVARSADFPAPPKVPCDDNHGDAIVLCFDLGPDAAEIHVGDGLAQMRLAGGWQF